MRLHNLYLELGPSPSPNKETISIKIDGIPLDVEVKPSRKLTRNAGRVRVLVSVLHMFD